MDASVRSVIEALRVSGQPNVSHADRVVAEQHCTSLYDHPSACEIAHRLVTHDGSQLDAALLERVQFFGHTLFREAISRQWQRWTPEQRASVKAVLLSYPTQLPADRLRSPIVRQKCAVALAEVARREWPQCWQELMPSLLNAGRTSAAHASIVMGVIRELAQECSDESTRGLPQRRRLEIVSGLQQACNDIFNTIGGYLTSLGQEGGEALLRAALEVFRDLSQVVSVSRLVELQVDEFLSSNLGKSDACRKTALQTFSTLASEVGRRKNKNRPANDMGLEHLNRLTIKIAGLAHAALPPPPPAPYTAEMHEVAMQVAYIVSEFLETSGDVLLQRLPAHTIAVLWRHGVVRLMRHPSMDLVAAVLHGAAMFIKQLGPRAQLPDWFLAEEFSSLLLVRIFRLGDPSLLAPMKELLGSEGLRAIDAVATDLTSTATGAGSDVPLRVDAHGISWTERVAQQVESEEMDTETDEGATSNVSIGAVFVDKYGKIKNACGHALRSTAALSEEICGYLIDLLAKLGQRVIASAAFQQGRKVDIEPLILSQLQQMISTGGTIRSGAGAPGGMDGKRLTESLSWISPTRVLLDGLSALIEVMPVYAKTQDNIGSAKTALPPPTTHAAAVNGSTSAASRSYAWTGPGDRLLDLVLTTDLSGANSVEWLLEVRRLEVVSCLAWQLNYSTQHAQAVVQCVVTRLTLIDPSEDGRSSTHSPSAVTAAMPTTDEFRRERVKQVRIRATWTLVGLSERCSNALTPYLNHIEQTVQSMLTNDKLGDTDRLHLLKTLISLNTSTQPFESQRQLLTAAIAPTIQQLTDPALQKAAASLPDLVQLLFSTSQARTDPAQQDRLVTQRGDLKRRLNALSVAVRWTNVPSSMEAAKKGGFLRDLPPLPPAAANSTTPSPTEPRIAIKHPLDDALGDLLPMLFSLLAALHTLWTPQFLESAEYRWTHSFLDIGEDDIITIEGPGVRTHPQIREEATRLYPGPRDVAMDFGWVRDARRQLFHIRIELYRLIGMLSRIKAGFYGHPRLAQLLTGQLVPVLAGIPCHHIPHLLSLVLAPIFAETSLPSPSEYPLLPLFTQVLQPIMDAIHTRITAEWTATEPSRVAAIQSNDFNETTKYQFRLAALSKASAKFTEWVGGFLKLNPMYNLSLASGSDPSGGDSTMDEGANRQQQQQQQQKKGKQIKGGKKRAPVDAAAASGGGGDMDEAENGTGGSVASSSLSDSALELKRFIYQTDALVAFLLRSLVMVMAWPEHQTLHESFTGLRVFLRTASIQFSPSPVSIVQFYKELVQTVAHVMVRPPTTDPSNLTNVNGNEGFVAAGAAGSSSSVVRGGKDMVLRSRLWEYLHLEEGTCCFLNDVVATVGECFRALVRHFRTQADKAKVDSSAANVYLCPPLHESFQLLSQLPVAPSADLLQSYRDAMLAKGEDDSVRRRYLLEILAPNYRAAMARDGSVTFSHTSTIQDLPISFLSTMKQRERGGRDVFAEPGPIFG